MVMQQGQTQDDLPIRGKLKQQDDTSTRALSKLILTKALQLADDANGFPNRYLNTFLGGTKLTHYDLR